MEASRVWPSPDAYQNAVLSPRRFLRDARLHRARVESRFFLGSTRPHLRSGNFGAVYKFTAEARAFALKVFFKADAGRQLRYQLIDQHLQGRLPTPHLVSFRYDEEGIQVHRCWYPTLVMDWAPGKTLDLYLHDCQGQIANGLFCQALVRMVQELRERGMAHGDLQHGNILVQGAGQLKLVDYDGMFVPPMRSFNLQAAECGLPAYQHPRRMGCRDYFDARLDDFAALVLFTTFAAITPERWQRYHRDDNQLLFSKLDLQNPAGSPLLGELARAAEPSLRQLAVLLREAAQGGLDQIPSFAEVVADPAIRGVLNSQWRPGMEGHQPLRRAPVRALPVKSPQPVSVADRGSSTLNLPVHARVLASARPALAANPFRPAPRVRSQWLHERELKQLRSVSGRRMRRIASLLLRILLVLALCTMALGAAFWFARVSPTTTESRRQAPPAPPCQGGDQKSTRSSPWSSSNFRTPAQSNFSRPCQEWEQTGSVWASRSRARSKRWGAMQSTAYYVRGSSFAQHCVDSGLCLVGVEVGSANIAEGSLS